MKKLATDSPESFGEFRERLLPINDTLDILRGKWKIQILASLYFGKKRFKVLQRDVMGISARMLAKELRDLEMNELVVRNVYDSMPVTVEYELSSYGKTLKQIIIDLENWGVKHRKRILGRARRGVR